MSCDRYHAAGMPSLVKFALRRMLVAVFFIGSIPMAVANDSESAEALRVGRITINAIPLFDAAEVRQGSFYRAANLLHVQTRAALVARFLLFREGDRYDPVKLEETERNLRQFDFLKSASVTAGTPHEGIVDITVVTQDVWTTDINGDFSNDGGKAAYAVDVTQKDLFGSGSELELHLGTGIERRANTIEFLHPAIFGPYWSLDTLYSRNSDGNEQKLELDRPLFSYSTPWSMSFLFDHDLRNARTFREGEVAARFRQEHRELSLSRSHVLKSDPGGSSRLVGGVDLIDDSFDNLPERPDDLIPASRHFRFIDAGYESTAFRFQKLDYVDRDLREQDFNLGRFSSVHAGLSPRLSAGRQLTWRLRAAEGLGHAFGARSFLIGQISLSTRAPRDRNQVISGDVRWVTRFETRYPQSFVARARLDLGWNLDRDTQFLADGQSGLRAYPDFAFEGGRRFIFNAEHRVFLGREILQIFGPGAAVFVDSGQAVDGHLRLGGMKTDVGVGLRLGMARFESALIRVDLAYALNASPLNRRGTVVSISTVQAF
jgi:hypothetical protein